MEKFVKARLGSDQYFSFFHLRALRLYPKELGTQLQATVSTTKSHQSPEEFR